MANKISGKLSNAKADEVRYENYLVYLLDNKIKEGAAKQRKLCEERKLPNFVLDSWCSCGRNVFERYDGTSLVTGCPFCCKTYCD